MKMFIRGVLFCSLFALATVQVWAGGSQVEIQTSKGNIVIELDREKAPVSVKNFLTYAQATLYDGTIFHRVIPVFMIQGGGFDAGMSGRTTIAPIKNEADNGLLNSRGTLSMARTQVVASATTQFFINVADNAFLDHGDRDFGYAVFAKVVEGMDVVDKIVAVQTADQGGHQNVPVEPVVVTAVKRLEG